MTEERSEVTVAVLVRWLPVVAVLIAGIVLFFLFVRTPPPGSSTLFGG